jgi:hypothetical protein
MFSRGFEDQLLAGAVDREASSVLASLLYAAALDGRTMSDVYQWAHGIDDAAPEQILSAHPGSRRDLRPS